MIPKALDQTLGYNLYRAGLLYRRQLARALASRGMTPEQWQLLSILTEADLAGALTQAELVARSLRDAPTISRTLRRMERDGWVTRAPDEHDRRATRVRLTTRGRAAREDLLGVISRHLWPHLESLSRDEKSALLGLLKKLRCALGDAVLPPT